MIAYIVAITNTLFQAMLGPAVGILYLLLITWTIKQHHRSLIFLIPTLESILLSHI